MLTSKKTSQLSQHLESSSLKSVDIVDIENPMSTPANPCVSRDVDNVDIVDVFSNDSEKWEEGVI